MHVTALCVLLRFAASPGGDDAVEPLAAPVQAGPTTIAEVALTSEGLDLEVLREALALRTPGVRVRDGSAPCDSRCAVVHARRGPEGRIELSARLGDGRTYVKRLDGATDEPERALATSLAHLLAAIEDGTAIAEPTVPAPATTPVTTQVPPVVAPPSPATDTRASAPPPTVTPGPPRPRLELGPSFALVSAFGVGPPRSLAGAVGGGFALELELRTPRGLLLSLGTRGLQQRDGGLRLQRLRIALAAGYSLRRGAFELRALAAVTVEPWWVAQRDDRLRLDPGPPLLGGAVSLTPGFHAALGPNLRIHGGLRLEAAASSCTCALAAVQATDPAGAAFRLGGFELAALVQLGARWSIGRRR